MELRHSCCAVRGLDIKITKAAYITVKPQKLFIACKLHGHALPQLLASEPHPKLSSVKAFAPATVANLGPGFDFLGCAVEGLGDTVIAQISKEVAPGTIGISSISGDGSRLSTEPHKNCAGIAGNATLQLLGVRSVGISLSLHKGLPLGSGLGSSAASAAASAVAINALFGSPLSKDQLVLAGLESEAAVSGYHADNVAPSLMGGFVLVLSYSPLRLLPLTLPSNTDLFFVLVSPKFEAPTRKMRAVLPEMITMKEHVLNCSHAAALVMSIMKGDLSLLGQSLSADSIVEPKRSPLIPGMAAVKEAAVRAGSLGCTISGAGPTAVAITSSQQQGKVIAEEMVAAFKQHGNLEARGSIQRLDRYGARII